MSEIFTPIRLYCDKGEIQTTLFVSGGELVDNARAYVEEVCSGCKCWSTQKVEKEEAQQEKEWPGSVNKERVPKMVQLLVDRSRFKGGKSQIMVGQCTFVAAGSNFFG